MSGAVALSAAAHGNRVAWVSPTYKQSRPLWRWAEREAAIVGTISRSERTIALGQGFVGIYSADNADSMRGESFHLVIIDEASRVNEDVWTDVIQPTLADFAGDAILISTPKGRNWFWREWERGKSGQAGYASFTAPTSDNPNPNIKRAALLARERVSDRTYRQEWLAEFIDDGGGVFRGVRASATSTRESKAMPGGNYVAGLDWARTTDYTVLTIFETTSRREVFKDRFNQIGYSVQRDRIKAACERFKVSAVIAETNAMGEPNIEQLERDGVPMVRFTTTNTSKAMIIDALALAFEQDMITILNDETGIAELEAYEQTRLPGGMMRYAAPSGMHDDTVMSMALGWFGVLETNAPTQDGVYVYDDPVEISRY